MKKLLITAFISSLFIACSETETHSHDSSAQGVSKTVAVMQSASGSETKGFVRFTKVEDGIQVQGLIDGLTPGKHGFHVHQYGDCRKMDASSAGGHFNPEDHAHSGPDASERHIGDLGNITANDAGVASFDFVDKKLSFEGVTSIVGRAVIIHAGEDDLKSQPSGAAGARIACGTIGIVKAD